jgi:hypothetical protein
MTLYAGDEFYDDDVTSGPIAADVPIEGPVPTAVQNAWNASHENDERDIISVAVDGYYSEDIAAKVGMYDIRRATGVVDAQLTRVWQPDPKRPTFWRVEASYRDPSLRRKTVAP